MKAYLTQGGNLVAKYRTPSGKEGEITINKDIKPVKLGTIRLTQAQVKALEQANGNSGKLVQEMYPELAEAEWFQRGGTVYVDS